MTAFRFSFTERPIGSPEGLPKKRTLKVKGLNQLDARCRLTKALHKRGTRLHALLDVVTA
ncbi:hypothetical protein VPH49_21850 [Pseudomonas luteola]|uniref:hypothetical protein n=1 Tax=Pseudomonas luteola TaxID=47886 RepID=UPI003A87E5FE